MSTSEKTDFDRWLHEEFAESGSFTALVMLVEITENDVRPRCSIYFNVIGDETNWGEILGLFASANMDWDGAAFFPRTGSDEGPLDDQTARAELRELGGRFAEGPMVLNEGHFFDKWGRRLRVDEIEIQ